MSQATQHRFSGSYTANLLGNIQSNLAGLQGYDVMALELIQNADDAKAQEIIFDITDRGLIVRNSGCFGYCGDLKNKTCRFLAKGKIKCDFHRITDFASANKMADKESIGRFGIGFVSVYQVTDHPEIRSSGIKLTLFPELGQWDIEHIEESKGTSFFLPWADDPNTEARLALGVSHVSAEHIDQLAEDFQSVLRKSLLFLRHVRKAEVWRKGKLLLACDLDRSKGSELTVSFRPSGEIERWQILRADAVDAAERLCEKYSTLKSLHRSTKISIGLRIEPEPLDEGLLYAFLPTEQSTGLPLHINADFFPDPNRKSVTFNGHQHQQAWNEMLIDAAAIELARDPEKLLKMLGDVPLWQIIGQAYKLSNKPEHPSCFKSFWNRLKDTAVQAHIVATQDGYVAWPRAVYLDRTPLDEHQAKVFLKLGGRLAIEDLRPSWTEMNQLGALQLTLERLVRRMMMSPMANQEGGTTKVNKNELKLFYQPLWGIINDLLPDDPNTNPSVEDLLTLPFAVTEDMYAVTIEQSCAAPDALNAKSIAKLLPRLAIISRLLSNFSKIIRLVEPLDLGAVVRHISGEMAISTDPDNLRNLYSLFVDLDRLCPAEETVYQQLRKLPIWRSSSGELIKATLAFLPGDFTDPIGQADLLDTSVLSGSVKEFLKTKLDVQEQTFGAFVKTALPTIFGDNGPVVSAKKYKQLISELARHTDLVNDDDDIRQQLGSLTIVPTQDGGWSRPLNTYRRTDDLVKVLGESPHLWLDDSRILNTRSAQTFIDILGILSSPIAEHLVERMLSIAKENSPTEGAKRASGESFYVLCDNYEKWKTEKVFQDAIDDLKQMKCFPADGDTEEWHSADSLYAPFSAEAFRSQANILDFKNTQRLKNDLLVDLGVHISPETSLIIKHLQYCVSKEIDPHFSTYQMLSARARSEAQFIATELADQRCIYVESQKKFVRPNQVYWESQQLGRYAYSIPINYFQFKPFFDTIGVKNTPDGKDFIDILLDIVGEHFVQSKPVTGQDRAVYDICFSGIDNAHKDEEKLDLERLQKAPSILNLQNQLTYPDEVLLHDSEWHAGFFGGELDRALCKPTPELWPFAKEIGVRRLSERSQVELEFVGGSQSDESLYAEQLKERIEILIRLLHDKPTHIKGKIRNAILELTAVGYDVVCITALAYIGGDNSTPVSAPPAQVLAFYDIEKRRLILKRPVNDQSWAHILNALFHQLMPGESGNEIMKLTTSVSLLMEKPVEDAHCFLNAVGIPCSDIDTDHKGDLTSPSLDEIDGITEPDRHEESESTSVPVGVSGEIKGRPGSKEQNKQTGFSTPLPKAGLPDQGGRGQDFAAPRQESTERNGFATHADGSKGSGQGKQPVKKSRPEHKEQWDRRLLSYVRHKKEGSPEINEQNGLSEHNWAVEAVARSAVCAYEKDRGRVTEQMPQMHPGYDIISRNPVTGEDRFIEVKGVNGEWNQTGVGLSRLQFSNAQDYGDHYWLYVVEFVSDSEHMRVHPIMNPAKQVTAFMFDGNWRDAVTEEQVNPAARFVPGIRIQHLDMGCGTILDVVIRGSTRLLTIKFDGKPQVTPNVTLNLSRIHILEDSDDENNT